MSCRVLKRGVERLLANHLFERARAMNVESVRGAYIPTAKNKMVENLYRELGFAAAGAGDDGTAYWELRVRDYKPEPVQIAVSTDAEA
jgi:predicted enzyme involved in methoxymalonyl-ACP biosynthesis